MIASGQTPEHLSLTKGSLKLEIKGAREDALLEVPSSVGIYPSIIFFKPDAEIKQTSKPARLRKGHDRPGTP
ncbi:MAG: hypothetical protein C0613_11395 [Desulfobulbaceae bacterium]|nr:MAG: hypothetical protein C0613_11395 [Desulfobulbaceae bacterium]